MLRGVEPGVYEVTEAYAQNTGSATTNLVGTRFSITTDSDDIVITGLSVVPSSLPHSGDGYAKETYETIIQGCGDAGGFDHCRYKYTAETASAPSSGMVRLTKCVVYKEQSQCVSSGCSTAKKELGDNVTCDPPETIVAKRIPDDQP